MADSIQHDRILFPTDGSECAAEAQRHALDLARRYDADLHVLNVVNISAAATGMDAFAEYNTGDLIDELEDSGEEIVKAAATAARNEGIESVTATVLMGSPYTQILDYADDHDIDLVVMGTHGRRGFSRALLGSVTEKVVRHASIPVFTVHTRPDESSDA